MNPATNALIRAVVRPTWQASSMAGPSRLGPPAPRFLTVSARRPAKVTFTRTPAQTASRQPSSLRSGQASSPQAMSQATARAGSKAQTLDDTWPWHRIPSPPAAPGTIEEERLIFARPYEGPLGKRVKLLWILGPFYILVIGMYLTTPKMPTPEEVKEIENGTREDVRKELASRVVWTPVSIVSMTVFTLGSLAFMFLPTRVVTRLTQVRIRPDTPSVTGIGVKERKFIRMSHGGHLMMWGKRGRPRELPMDQVSVNMINTRSSSPWLDVSVKAPHRTRYNFDTIPFRLDFRDTKALNTTEEEVVLSLPRLEAVFGRLG